MAHDQPPPPNCPRCGEKLRLLHKLFDPKAAGRSASIAANAAKRSGATSEMAFFNMR
jgi:hypothetical protein